MNLVVRVDAGPEIGYGHLIRCLALAQEWEKQGGEVYFVTRTIEYVKPLVQKMPIYTTLPDHAPEQIVYHAQNMNADWVVVDGYHFTADYYKAVTAAGLKLLVINDFEYPSLETPDIILDQNPQANCGFRMKIRGDTPPTTILKGPEYALLRKQFLARYREKRTPLEVRRVLVTVGGGAAGRELKTEILTILAELGLETIEFDGWDTAAEHMYEADLAVTAAGSTLHEMAFMGLPAICVSVAANQEPLAAGYEKLGSIKYLGQREEVTQKDIRTAVKSLLYAADTRKEMSDAGKKAVDGQGAARVVKYMSE